MKIAFVHPDLGLGGAERLVVDAALALQTLGHDVTIYTSFLDPHRCFPEVHPNNPQIPVYVLASTVPRAVCGRFHAVLAAIRCTYIATYVAVQCKTDVVICDVVAMPLLVLWAMGIPSVFYCHFPDKELVKTLNRETKGRPRMVYRMMVDLFDELGLRCAGHVICNSKFTQDVFVKSFSRLPAPSIVYPCVREPVVKQAAQSNSDSCVFVSINRYERKKNIELAIDAFAHLNQTYPLSDSTLIIAGGYDKRLPENIDYYTELNGKSRALGLEDKIKFMQNLSEEEKDVLLATATGVVYTPAEEHFGIVPLEAMVRTTPVIAVNSGGPAEVIKHEVTGYLCPPNPAEFSKAMANMMNNPTSAAEMGTAARNHVLEKFSMTSLAKGLQGAIDKAVVSVRPR